MRTSQGANRPAALTSETDAQLPPREPEWTNALRIWQSIWMTRSYWLTVFTVETWNEFLDHGGDVAGFSEARWSYVCNIRPGDYLVCYIMRISKFSGLLEVVGEPFVDRQPIWSSRVFASRVPVQVLLKLEPDQGIPVKEMFDELTIFDNLANLKYWSSKFQTSPYRWNKHDGDTIVGAIQAKLSSNREK
jgi:hypothetical protein